MEKKKPNKQPKKQTNQKIPNTTQQDFGIFSSWVFPKAVLNLASCAVSQALAAAAAGAVGVCCCRTAPAPIVSQAAPAA